jgi:zona occludens toxin
MALNLYTGDPGAGKSYSVVANVIIPALKKDRHVVTNIPLESELLVEVFGGRITQLPLDALDNPDLPQLIPNGAVAVIDECWNRWPSGQRIQKAPKEDLHWLKEHRHRVDEDGNAMQVVLCTQNPADLAKWVRDLIAHTFWMTKLEELGADQKYSVRIYKKAPTGEPDKIPKRYLLRVTYGTYDPDVYQYYKSATQSKSNDVGDEKAMDKRTSLWRSPGFLFQMFGAPVLFLCSMGFLFYVGHQWINGGKEPEQEEVAKVDAPVLVNPPPPDFPVAPVVLPVAQKAVAPVESVTVQGKAASSSWRVAGYIRRGDQQSHPDDSSGWNSRLGYGDRPDRQKLARSDQAILVSVTGVRYVPLSECQPYSDGFNYSCDVDGERVTPWSGRMGFTDTVPGSAVSGARNVTVERSETVTSAAPARHAEIPAQVPVTVVADNSRMPRTLLGSNPSK